MDVCSRETSAKTKSVVSFIGSALSLVESGTNIASLATSFHVAPCRSDTTLLPYSSSAGEGSWCYVLAPPLDCMNMQLW